MVEDPEGALTALVDARGQWLVRCAFLLTKDREAALDLTQDTLLRAWRGWDKVSRADDSERYLMRIMLNLFRDGHRRRRAPELPWEGLVAEAAASGVSRDFTAEVVEADAIAAAIAELNPRQRAVIVLRYWADYSDQDIAGILGCRRSTVRSLAARSLKLIQRRIGGDES